MREIFTPSISQLFDDCIENFRNSVRGYLESSVFRSAHRIFMDRDYENCLSVCDYFDQPQSTSFEIVCKLRESGVANTKVLVMGNARPDSHNILLRDDAKLVEINLSNNSLTIIENLIESQKYKIFVNKVERGEISVPVPLEKIESLLKTDQAEDFVKNCNTEILQHYLYYLRKKCNIVNYCYYLFLNWDFSDKSKFEDFAKYWDKYSSGIGGHNIVIIANKIYWSSGEGQYFDLLWDKHLPDRNYQLNLDLNLCKKYLSVDKTESFIAQLFSQVGKNGRLSAEQKWELCEYLMQQVGVAATEKEIMLWYKKVWTRDIFFCSNGSQLANTLFLSGIFVCDDEKFFNLCLNGNDPFNYILLRYYFTNSAKKEKLAQLLYGSNFNCRYDVVLKYYFIEKYAPG